MRFISQDFLDDIDLSLKGLISRYLEFLFRDLSPTKDLSSFIFILECQIPLRVSKLLIYHTSVPPGHVSHTDVMGVLAMGILQYKSWVDDFSVLQNLGSYFLP